MFRFRKTLDIVTVFHKASSPASVRVSNLMKQASANASAGATLDQASDHSAQNKFSRDPFELNITEDPPTTDQVQTILGYVGKGGISAIIKGAKDEQDALKRFKENKDSFFRPTVVDWNNGKAVVGDNESEILKMLSQKE
ncbi:thioredoxin-like protein [Stachybotrys elegans]|uniref:Thioredoxin-like protein n=1 Tax=Stachybotrys elegans TaxID=80388 RepID=A0A8K0SPS5_9HYPO|nr:thioredoxin-like protein [Stachybotrys elegans]